MQTAQELFDASVNDMINNHPQRQVSEEAVKLLRVGFSLGLAHILGSFAETANDDEADAVIADCRGFCEMAERDIRNIGGH